MEMNYKRADGKQVTVYTEEVFFNDGRNRLEKTEAFYIIEKNKKVRVDEFGFKIGARTKQEKPKIYAEQYETDEEVIAYDYPVKGIDTKTKKIATRYYIIKNNKRIEVKPIR
jgi:hypothetical protein